MKKVRVRYAPSPTGYLHIGNARTALFNYLYAKHNNGDLIVRIEDTDTARNVEDGVKSQLENLAWLGIKWDESVDVGGPHAPYNQLARTEAGIYQPFIDELLEKGLAYRCFCTSEELDQEAEQQKANGEIPKYSGKCRHLTEEQIQEKLTNGEEYTIRFKVPENQEINWNDMVKGPISFNSNDVSGDFNIVKRDGIPTYNFVVVLDDHLMEISHILRGEDHISNTPKQIMIYQALGFEVPEFGHMSLIVNEEGKKLSKRDTSIIQFIEDYKKLGYLPEAMFNFITLLGWSPVGEEEIYSQTELIDIFDEHRLSKSSAKFDVNKLSWINNQYIKRLSDEAYLSLVLPFVDQNVINNFDQQTVNQICLLFKDQISYGAEITDLVNEFLDVNLEQEAIEFVKENDLTSVIECFRNKLSTTNINAEEDVKALIKEVQAETGNKGKMLFMPIRIGISGKMHGPELPQIVLIFGKDKIIETINTNLANLQ